MQALSSVERFTASPRAGHASTPPASPHRVGVATNGHRDGQPVSVSPSRVRSMNIVSEFRGSKLSVDDDSDTANDDADHVSAMAPKVPTKRLPTSSPAATQLQGDGVPSSQRKVHDGLPTSPALSARQDGISSIPAISERPTTRRHGSGESPRDSARRAANAIADAGAKRPATTSSTVGDGGHRDHSSNGVDGHSSTGSAPARCQAVKAGAVGVHQTDVAVSGGEVPSETTGPLESDRRKLRGPTDAASSDGDDHAAGFLQNRSASPKIDTGRTRPRGLVSPRGRSGPPTPAWSADHSATASPAAAAEIQHQRGQASSSSSPVIDGALPTTPLQPRQKSRTGSRFAGELQGSKFSGDVTRSNGGSPTSADASVVLSGRSSCRTPPPVMTHSGHPLRRLGSPAPPPGTPPSRSPPLQDGPLSPTPISTENASPRAGTAEQQLSGSPTNAIRATSRRGDRSAQERSIRLMRRGPKSSSALHGPNTTKVNESPTPEASTRTARGTKSPRTGALAESPSAPAIMKGEAGAGSAQHDEDGVKETGAPPVGQRDAPGGTRKEARRPSGGGTRNASTAQSQSRGPSNSRAGRRDSRGAGAAGSSYVPKDGLGARPPPVHRHVSSTPTSNPAPFPLTRQGVSMVGQGIVGVGAAALRGVVDRPQSDGSSSTSALHQIGHPIPSTASGPRHAATHVLSNRPPVLQHPTAMTANGNGNLNATMDRSSGLRAGSGSGPGSPGQRPAGASGQRMAPTAPAGRRAGRFTADDGPRDPDTPTKPSGRASPGPSSAKGEKVEKGAKDKKSKDAPPVPRAQLPPTPELLEMLKKLPLFDAFELVPESFVYRPSAAISKITAARKIVRDREQSRRLDADAEGTPSAAATSPFPEDASSLTSSVASLTSNSNIDAASGAASVGIATAEKESNEKDACGAAPAGSASPGSSSLSTTDGNDTATPDGVTAAESSSCDSSDADNDATDADAGAGAKGSGKSKKQRRKSASMLGASQAIHTGGGEFEAILNAPLDDANKSPPPTATVSAVVNPTAEPNQNTMQTKATDPAAGETKSVERKTVGGPAFEKETFDCSAPRQPQWRIRRKVLERCLAFVEAPALPATLTHGSTPETMIAAEAVQFRPDAAVRWLSEQEYVVGTVLSTCSVEGLMKVHSKTPLWVGPSDDEVSSARYCTLGQLKRLRELSPLGGTAGSPNHRGALSDSFAEDNTAPGVASSKPSSPDESTSSGVPAPVAQQDEPSLSPALALLDQELRVHGAVAMHPAVVAARYILAAFPHWGAFDAFQSLWEAQSRLLTVAAAPHAQLLHAPLIDGVQFSSTMECGNLVKVERRLVGATPVYALWTDGDCSTAKRTWFRFSATGFEGSAVLYFRMMNLAPNQKLYRHGMRPVWRCGNIQRSWTPVPEVSFVVSPEEHGQLSFAIQPPSPLKGNDELHIAFTVPYGYTDLLRYVSLWHDAVRTGPRNIRFEERVLCRTPDNRKLHLLILTSQTELKVKKGALNAVAEVVGKVTGSGSRRSSLKGSAPVANSGGRLSRAGLRPSAVTPSGVGVGSGAFGSVDLGPGFNNPHPLSKDLAPYSNFGDGKRAVLISGRVHPSEVTASHALHGLITFLLSSDPRAAVLRSHFIFFIVPMLNPDGVARGHTRLDQFGNNLNRCYNNPSTEEHPTVVALKKVYEHLQATYRERLTLYVDFHSHASQKSGFVFGNFLSTQVQSWNMLFARLIDVHTPPNAFDYNVCKFGRNDMSAKDGSSRVLFGAGTANSYTCEVAHYTVKGTLEPAFPTPHPAMPADKVRRSTIEPGEEPVDTPVLTEAADVGRGVLLALLDYCQLTHSEALGKAGGFLDALRQSRAAALNNSASTTNTGRHGRKR